MLRDLPDEAATRSFAAELAGSLPRGAMILLDGPLGAGKTTFVAGLVEALGSPARTSSPTYTLVHEYPSPEGTVVHVDAYRLPDVHDLDAIGLDEYLARARLVAVEWGGGLAEAYPEAWQVRLERHPDRPGRTAVVNAPRG